MSQLQHQVDSVLAKNALNADDRAALIAAFEPAGRPLDDLFNSIAIKVARRFNNQEMNFDDAGSIINDVSAMMLENLAQHQDDFAVAEPCWAIYLAFDAGEYDHGDGVNPIEQYTRPLIAQIVKSL